MRVQEYGTRAAEPEGAGKSGSTRPRVFSGYGVNTDTIVAAAEAYVGALNKLFYTRQERRRAAGNRADHDAPLHAVDLFGNSVLGQHEV
jgi:2-isopropylmalate synthase